MKKTKRCRALVGLNYIGTEAMHKRVVGGEHGIPREDRGEVRVEAGEEFDCPPWAFADLSEMGAIEEVISDG